MYRFHPMWSRVLEAIWGGRIGTVTSIASRFTFRLEDRAEIPANAELGGGALMDVGCYCVDLARRIAATEPVRAIAFERRTTVDDTLHGMLEFPAGVVAQFECSIESHERQRAEIAGTDGAIWIDHPWFPGVESASFLVRREGGREEVVTTPGGDPYRLEVEDFVAVVSGRRKPRWGIEDAIANMAAIDALYASARSGRAEPVAQAVDPRARRGKR
jgi:predicted dehydrogenase